MPQDHHYIPVFYLRRWTDEGGHLYGFWRPQTSLQAPFAPPAVQLSHCDHASRLRGDRTRTLPLGSVAFENKTDQNGYRLIWLEPRVVDRLMAMRGRGQSFSDVILRLAAEQSR